MLQAPRYELPLHAQPLSYERTSLCPQLFHRYGVDRCGLEAVEEHDPVFSRLAKANKLEVNKNFECVRLKEQQ